MSTSGAVCRLACTAASTSAQRRCGEPALARWPRRLVSPDSSTTGSRPARRVIWLGAAEAAGFADLGERWLARIGPIRSMVCNARQRASLGRSGATPGRSCPSCVSSAAITANSESTCRRACRGASSAPPSAPRRAEQTRPRAGPAFVAAGRRATLPPAALVLGERLTQPRSIAQPLDLLGRDPRLRAASLSPTSAPASAHQGRSVFALRRRPSNAARAPARPGAPGSRAQRAHANPTPAGRRLDRHRRDPAPPLPRPASQALPVRREPGLDHLPAVGIEHRRLERVLMDIDCRVQLPEPPPDDRGSDRPQRSGQNPYDIQEATLCGASPSSRDTGALGRGQLEGRGHVPGVVCSVGAWAPFASPVSPTSVTFI